ncbi:MAG: alpha/beta fold hydrolase [Clostridia bacterium]|nr:alpha/beta fold hydrolase [Clostridia bacterium]
MFEKTIKRNYYETFGSRCDDPGFNRYYTYRDFDGMKETPFSFTTGQGNVLRGGLYYYGEDLDSYDSLIVFFHGMTVGYLSYMNEINVLAKAGFLVLSYDITATFSSDGQSLQGFARPLYDFKYALAAIKADERLYKKRLSLIGHSWGGFTAMNALSFCEDDISCAVCISPPISYEAMLRQQFDRVVLALIKPSVVRLERSFFGDLADVDGLDIVNNHTKMLFIYSEDDPTVLYKYNYAPLEKKDNNPLHKRIAYKDRGHFPHYEKEALKKLTEIKNHVRRLIAEGRTVEEIAALARPDNWDDVVKQDEAVWKDVIDFLKDNA